MYKESEVKERREKRRASEGKKKRGEFISRTRTKKGKKVKEKEERGRIKGKESKKGGRNSIERRNENKGKRKGGCEGKE